VPPFVSFLAPLPNLPGEGIGHFVGAMRVDAFRPKADFKSHMDNWIQRFKASQRIDENTEVFIPGEPEFRMHQERSINGFGLNQNVFNDLLSLAKKFDLTL
jgi:LDH2 family malate/lactate/ureidoglycolate dehydrogenase